MMQKRLLLIRFSSLGDVVLTSGPIEHLHKKFPNSQIDFLTSEIGEELFGSHPSLNKIHVVPKGSGLLQLRQIYKTLPKYDIVIDWQNNFKSHFSKFYVYAQTFRVNKQSQKRRLFVKKRKFKEDLQKHVVEKYYDVIAEALNLPPAELETLRPYLFATPLTYVKEEFDFSKAVVLHPFASQKNKEWPGFQELADKLIEMNIPVVVIGSTKSPLTWREHHNLMDLTNKTALREMLSLLATSKVLVTTDSGPLHMGIGVNIPTLALFGPTTKEFGFYPLFDKTKVIEVQGLDCRPCHVHGGNTCPLGHHKCMKDISVDRLLEELSSFI